MGAQQGSFRCAYMAVARERPLMQRPTQLDYTTTPPDEQRVNKGRPTALQHIVGPTTYMLNVWGPQGVASSKPSNARRAGAGTAETTGAPRHIQHIRRKTPAPVRCELLKSLMVGRLNNTLPYALAADPAQGHHMNSSTCDHQPCWLEGILPSRLHTAATRQQELTRIMHSTLAGYAECCTPTSCLAAS